MRIIVFFDLPVVTKGEKKAYRQFRNFLLNDGYNMLQYSIYTRICKGTSGTIKHTERLEMNKPISGSVRVLIVTDRQFQEMKLLVGEKIQGEDEEGEQLVLF